MNKLTIEQFVDQMNNDNFDYALPSLIITGEGVVCEDDEVALATGNNIARFMHDDSSFGGKFTVDDVVTSLIHLIQFSENQTVPHYLNQKQLEIAISDISEYQLSLVDLTTADFSAINFDCLTFRYDAVSTKDLLQFLDALGDYSDVKFKALFDWFDTNVYLEADYSLTDNGFSYLASKEDALADAILNSRQVIDTVEAERYTDNDGDQHFCVGFNEKFSNLLTNYCDGNAAKDIFLRKKDIDFELCVGTKSADYKGF